MINRLCKANLVSETKLQGGRGGQGSPDAARGGRIAGLWDCGIAGCGMAGLRDGDVGAVACSGASCFYDRCAKRSIFPKRPLRLTSDSSLDGSLIVMAWANRAYMYA